MTPSVAQLAKLLQGQARFIVFEGGDGSGKTTQIRLLQEALAGASVPVLATFEPGATELGGDLRRLVMHGPEDVDARTEALLYAADRAYHVATVIRPALASGTTVLEDRYLDSSVAYQGLGRGLGPDTIRDLSLWATDGLLPDAVVVLDVAPEVAAARLGEDRDRLERAGGDFHARVRDHFISLTEANPEHYLLVDTDATVGEVHRRVVTALSELFA